MGGGGMRVASFAGFLDFQLGRAGTKCTRESKNRAILSTPPVILTTSLSPRPLPLSSRPKGEILCSYQRSRTRRSKNLCIGKTKILRELMRGTRPTPFRVLPVLAYLVDSAVLFSLCPKGATYISPGLLRSYPGSARATQPTLKGLRHCFPRPPLRNPVGVGSLCLPFPG